MYNKENGKEVIQYEVELSKFELKGRKEGRIGNNFSNSSIFYFSF